MASVLDPPLVQGNASPPAAPPAALGHGDGGGAVFDPARFGLLAFLGTVSMLFIGFTSAYMVRRSSADWGPIAAPSLLFVNTALLLGASLALERSRRALRALDLGAASLALGAAGLLGFGFLAGQLGAWRQLAAAGVFLASSPHASFFYVLTGLHGVHLLGGVIWLAVALVRARRIERLPGSDPLGGLALYWHFLFGLWLYLAVLLFLF